MTHYFYFFLVVPNSITFFFLLQMINNNQKNLNKSNKTIVIKIGTSSICNEVTHFPLLSNLSAIVETVLSLRALGHRVVLVSSAAVGTGLRRLNIAEKPSRLAARQVNI